MTDIIDPGPTEHDAEPRTVELAPDARAALELFPAAVEQWDQLSYSDQRDYHQWIESAEKAGTRQRRIGKMVSMVAEGLKLK